MELEHVVLVDEANAVLGTMLKANVHCALTPLHRGFSLFLFNRSGELLLQQRSALKKTWPLVWSNSVCGHPKLEESNIDAARRRLALELDMSAENVEEVAPYRYCYTRDGVMENEICPILVGFSDGGPIINADEVAATRWIKWREFLRDIRERPEKYSDWCVEEAGILDASARFHGLVAV